MPCSPGQCDPGVPVHDDPPVPHDGGHVVPGHLHRGGGAQVSRDEHPVPGVGAARDLHPRQVNHLYTVCTVCKVCTVSTYHPLDTERHWGRVIRVTDEDIAGPRTEVDIKVPGERPELQLCNY